MSGSNLLKPLEQQLKLSFPQLRDERAQKAAYIIQAAWKLYKVRQRKRQAAAIAASKCDCPLCYFRLICKRHRLFYLNRCATKIQATWLGYHTRKNALRDRDFRLIYRALLTVNANATEDNQLGRRYAAAYSKLSSSTNRVNHIETDLATLEVTTRLSPECCLKAASSNVINMMVNILNDANRSEAHKSRINYAFSVLVNIVVYSRCSKYIKNGEAIAGVCMKMIKIHKKSDQIFLKCSTLLALIVHNKKIKEAITKDPMHRFTISNIIPSKSNGLDYGKTADIIKLIKGNAIKFEPHWCLKKGTKHYFTDRLTAQTYLAYLFDS